MGNKDQNMKQEEEKKSDDAHKAVVDKANEVEQALTQNEEAMDLTGMKELNLGDHQNYKTRLV